MKKAMRICFIRWIVVGIGVLAVSLVFLGLHTSSLQGTTIEQNKNPRDDVNTDYNMIDHQYTPANLKLRQDKQLPIDIGMSNLKENLIKLAKEIQETKIHIRGTKARQSLTNAIDVVKDLFRLTNTSMDTFHRKTKSSKHICKEIYKGTTYGYPFFYKGFETKNCSYATSIDKLVTVVFIHKEETFCKLEHILKNILNYNPRLKVVVGKEKNSRIPLSESFGNVTVIDYSKADSDGTIWNLLITKVKTEYALIARNISTFNIDARLERLVREIEALDVVTAGGASRDQDGRWKLGCYQSVYKNFSLIYDEGYDESLHECIFCDYISGSFLSRLTTFQSFPFDAKMNGISVFHDFFLRLSQGKLESVICPDSMFYMRKQKQSVNYNDWAQLGIKWKLYRMKISDGVDVQFPCRKENYKCFNGLGYILSPCCLQELADMINFIMKTCEESNILCELQEGTLLGAVKFHKVLPWERDADLTFLTANFTALTKLKSYIMKKYSFTYDAGSLWCCADNRTAGGKMKVHSKHWHIEMYGQHQMDSEMLLTDGLKPTKLLLNGQWVGVPRNPGWHARNRYGHEIYAHAQHWMAMGQGNGWIDYKTNHFTPCRTPGRHDCVDSFNGDGNLPFSLPIP
ncbi:uncharacterized protein LOC134696003 [Mytilus trossulus]|uniref:uncharacterized protein LOC134696003 n=1 Tax=Mytilus trossulus TaxID=6551 RepID=UPI00300420CE